MVSTRQLQNIYACTSPPVYLCCWNEQACRSHVCILVWMHHTKEKPVAVMFAQEKQVCHILIRVPDPHILVLWGRIKCLSICGANWLNCLLGKSRHFKFKYRPLRPILFKIWCMFIILWLCKWSITITILNHSQVATSVAKKKQALYIWT